MGFDIQHLHHVGHVVNDMEEGLELYRRLGFRLSPPTYPILSPKEGAPPQPVGAANTHANFLRNFVELMTCVGEGSRIPRDAKLVPLHAPPERLPHLNEAIRRTTAKIARCLSRFQGLHILVFQTPNADDVAERLRSEGVIHGGVNTAQRPMDTELGMRMDPVRFLEIDSDDPKEAGADRVPEGRIAVAENPTAEVLRTQRYMDHPNGAVDLVDSVLCVADADLPDVERRYKKYLGRAARIDGPARVFDLERSRLTLVADSALGAVLPGERAPQLPAFVAYAVTVRDIDAARRLLQENGFPLRVSASGDTFVPAAAALGGAIIFRPED